MASCRRNCNCNCGCNNNKDDSNKPDLLATKIYNGVCVDGLLAVKPDCCSEGGVCTYRSLCRDRRPPRPCFPLCVPCIPLPPCCCGK